MQRTKSRRKKPHIVCRPSGKPGLVNIWDMANDVLIASDVATGKERVMTEKIKDYRDSFKDEKQTKKKRK